MMETAKAKSFSKRTSNNKLLFKSSWVNLMKMYWVLLGNSVATVLVVYGAYLIIHH